MKEAYSSLRAHYLSFQPSPFPINTIVSKYLTANIQFSTMIFGRFLLATIFSAIICLYSGTILSFGTITVNNWIILLISFITLGPISIYLYYYGINKVKAMVSAIAELALPLSVIILDYLINGTRLSIVQWTRISNDNLRYIENINRKTCQEIR